MKMPFKNARPLGRVSLLLALALVTMTGLCAWTSSCGTAAHKASVAAASIGASLQTAATVNHEMLTAGEETAAEGALVAGYIDQAAKSNDAFTKTLQSLPDSGSQLTSTQAITAFNTLVTQITTLQTQGVLHLKSTKAQAALSAVITTIQASITIIQAEIASTSSGVPRHGPNPFPPGAPLLGLTLTAEEIEELIALAIAAGSALVTKLIALRGETDPQLLTSALASDAAAETQAEADEKA
jgi:hypothetical protein